MAMTPQQFGMRLGQQVKKAAPLVPAVDDLRVVVRQLLAHPDAARLIAELPLRVMRAAQTTKKIYSLVPAPTQNTI